MEVPREKSCKVLAEAMVDAQTQDIPREPRHGHWDSPGEGTKGEFQDIAASLPPTAMPGSPALIELLEEYALLIVFALAVAYFLYTRAKKGVDAVSYELKSRKAEDAIRRAREEQQARYWEDTSEKRAHLERIAEERRKDKLEDMSAAAEGRTSKAKKDLKPKDNRDYWDGKDGFSSMGGGGGSKIFKPSGSRRRGG